MGCGIEATDGLKAQTTGFLWQTSTSVKAHILVESMSKCSDETAIVSVPQSVVWIQRYLSRYPSWLYDNGCMTKRRCKINAEVSWW